MNSYLMTIAFGVWAAIHPGVGRRGDGPAVARAIATVVSVDDPVFGSPEEDAAVMAYWAWHESNINLRAVNHTGLSWGAWQQDARVGRADAVTQARAWYGHLRYGRGRCRNPAAVMWGRCDFQLVVAPWGTAETAADARVARARELLAAVEMPAD